MKIDNSIYLIAIVVFIIQMMAMGSIYREFFPIVRTEVVRDTIVETYYTLKPYPVVEYRDTCIGIETSVNYSYAMGYENFRAVTTGDSDVNIGLQKGF